jgi:hypothetical protein
MVHAADTVTYKMANDHESFNKEMESDSLSGMSCSHQTRRLEFNSWPAGLLKSVDCMLVDLRPKVGTLSTALC